MNMNLVKKNKTTKHNTPFSNFKAAGKGFSLIKINDKYKLTIPEPTQVTSFCSVTHLSFPIWNL